MLKYVDRELPAANCQLYTVHAKLAQKIDSAQAVFCKYGKRGLVHFCSP